MPVTFPAHQGLIVPIKGRWPHLIDGTALCIGAAAPDLAYPLGPWLSAQSHTAIGLVVWAVPVTVMMALLVRWRAADGVFTNLPDLGPLRLRSYRVLGWRRPAILVTVVSATIGASSHILIDGFTHTGRWGANALGLNDVVATVPIRGEMTEARILQYLGHVGGSLLFVGALLAIAATARLDRWYGVEVVARARQGPPTRGGHPVFWGLVGAAVGAAVAIGLATGQSILFVPGLATAVALVAVGTLVGRPAPAGSGRRPQRAVRPAPR